MAYSENFLMLGGEVSGVVNFPSIGFSNYAELPIFSGAKARLSTSLSGNFLMLRGENPEIVNSLFKFF